MSIEFPSMASEPEICRLFVYGTLMRGQCRERCWPHQPISVAAATTRGVLYDLGAYPAIAAGFDLVCGEIWQIHPDHMEQTLRVLDEVEGYSGLGDDLFIRRVVRCTLDDGRELAAWGYFYNQPDELTDASRIPIGGRGAVHWPRDR